MQDTWKCDLWPYLVVITARGIPTHFLQCPHQGAKNSTIHTSSPCSTILSKLSSVSTTTSSLLPLPPLCCWRSLSVYQPFTIMWDIFSSFCYYKMKRLRRCSAGSHLFVVARAARFSTQPLFYQSPQSVHGSVHDGLAAAHAWKREHRGVISTKKPFLVTKHLCCNNVWKHQKGGLHCGVSHSKTFTELRNWPINLFLNQKISQDRLYFTILFLSCQNLLLQNTEPTVSEQLLCISWYACCIANSVNWSKANVKKEENSVRHTLN